MAGKSQHVHDSCVVERRLRPIYDWLDVGNNKKALQEIEKVLRKSPSLQCARALKSLATLRLGKEQEALQLLDALATEQPADDATLQVMTIGYRESQQLDKVCRLYEAAVRQDGTNEELLTHLFMSYVRVADLVGQQHAAMTLYRLKPKNPYYFWAVMSIVLQATKGVGDTDPVKRTVLLALAQRMIDKLIAENKLEADQEVQLYVTILQRQNKHSAALDFLAGPIARRLASAAPAIPNAPIDPLGPSALPLLLALQRWSILNCLCRRLLCQQPDRWDYYTLYLQSASELARPATASGAATPTDTVSTAATIDAQDDADDSPEKCHEFLCGLAERAQARPLRGPYLARLLLYQKLHQEDRDPQSLMGNAADLLVEYFRMFGHKACCVADLRPYLSLVAESERDTLAQRFMDTVGISAVSLPQNEDQMQRHICSQQLSRMLGVQRRLEERAARALASALWLHRERAALSSPRCPTQRAPADPYGLLAAHLCWDLALKTESSQPLLEALGLLERVLENSPSNFHCKLLCIKFYHFLGCGVAAQTVYETLDVKHVQLDSLCHVHCARLSTSGLPQLARDAYDATVKFFCHSYKDSVNHLTFSYKFGSFMKLEELMEWRERLNSSLMHAHSAVERTLLGAILAPSHTAAVRALSQGASATDVAWDSLRDNRDLSVYTHWDPLEIHNPNLAEETFQQDKTFLRLKCSLLQCVVAAMTISTAEPKQTNAERESNIAALETASSEFGTLLSRLEGENTPDLGRDSAAGPLPCRLVRFTKSSMGLRAAYAACFDCVVVQARGTEDTTALDACLDALYHCGDAAEACLRKHEAGEDPLWTARDLLEDLVNYIEVLSVACVCIGCCAELRRAGRKSKGAASGIRGTRLAELASRGARAVTNLPVPPAPELTEALGSLSVREGAEAVGDQTRRAHAAAAAALAQVLQDKAKYAAALNI